MGGCWENAERDREHDYRVAAIVYTVSANERIRIAAIVRKDILRNRDFFSFIFLFLFLYILIYSLIVAKQFESYFES